MKLQTTKYNYTFCILLRGVALNIMLFLKESLTPKNELRSFSSTSDFYVAARQRLVTLIFFARFGELAGFLFHNVVMLNLFNSIAMLNLYDFAQSPEGALWAGGCHHYGNCRRQ